MPRTPPHLTNLESALAGLTPHAGGLNRDRLMYEAGRRAAPCGYFWPMAASLFAALSASLALCIAAKPEPEPRILERPVYLPTPIPQIAIEAPPSPIAKNDEAKWGNAFRSSAGYLSQRDRVLYFGLESLPVAPIVPEASHEQPQDLKSLHKLI